MTLRKMQHVFSLACVLLLCLFLTGCLTGRLTPATLTMDKKFDNSVSVVANTKICLAFSGGRSSTLRSAIENAIQKHGVFSNVVHAGTADYSLEVVETEQTLPVSFGDITSGLTWDWKLTRTQTQKVIWQESIRSQVTATFGDSFFSWIASVRMRHATDGAIRENIRIGLEKISALSI